MSCCSMRVDVQALRLFLIYFGVAKKLFIVDSYCFLFNGFRKGETTVVD